MKLFNKIRHLVLNRQQKVQGRFTKNNQIRSSCSLDFLNEIRAQQCDTLNSVSSVNLNPSGIFDQGGNGLSPVTPPPRHRYISPERRKKAGQSSPSSVASTPTPAKAVFILQKSDSRESVHIDVSIIDDALNPHDTLSNVTSTTTLPVRSTEVGDDDSIADNFKFSRTRSMRGPKGLRISKLFPQGREPNVNDSTAALTFSSEDEGKGNSDQSESPPPLPPRRHRSRPGTSMSYRSGHKHTDTNSISSEESFPSIPCLATDLHKLRVSGDVPPSVPPKSPLVTRIEVTGEPVKPTVISTDSVHIRSRSEVLCGSVDRRLSPSKRNVRTKSSDNIIRNRRNQTKKSESSDSVDEGIVISTPPKTRSHSAGRTRKFSEEIECYNVYNVRTGKITTSVQKPDTTIGALTGKRPDRHQNCKKCIHATKS